MLQEKFLNAIIQARAPVTIYLTNGIRLLGELKSFDQYGVVLGGASQQFIFKHAISTVVPTREISTTTEEIETPVPAAEPKEAPPPPTATVLRPRKKRLPPT
jgi:host factor-I protein